jgi:Glycosyl transferase family 2
MKIFGLALVKNEEDIIRETFGKAAEWCDAIHVFDTGSSDGTWEVVCEMAKENNRIVPFRKETRAFRDELRAELFGAVRGTASPGDWWCRLDADEIYIDDPREFLAGVPPLHHAVFSASCQYYFTERELAGFEEDPAAFFAQPAEQRLRYYECNWSEVRFCRHRAGLVWSGTSWPTHMGLAHPGRIRLKHLQYRSPDQIQRRLETRAEAIRQGYKIFAAYDQSLDWRDKIRASSELAFDDGSGAMVVDETKLPRHLERSLHRAGKFVMHGLGFWP